jgi:5S rRNA maturation endonuclease (ribonuclease M5)
MNLHSKKDKISREKIYSISSEVLEKLPELLNHFNIDFTEFENRIAFACPVHNGDNCEGACIFVDGEKSKGNWVCWTHSCEKDFGKNIIGFVRGILSNRQNKEASFYTAINYCLSFLNKKLIDIKEEKIPESIYNNVKMVEIFTRKPEKIDLNIPREKIIESLEIPSKYYIERGYLPETLVAFDVGECYNPNRQMYNRAVVPIYDEDGKYIGCVGRTLDEDNKKYKWLNSKGFKKSFYLYGLSIAKPFIQKTSTIILVEGQGDVWRLYEAGIKNCVGIFGSDLSEDQLVILETLGVMNVVILTDNDEAGQKAAQGIINRGGRRFNYFTPKISKKDIGEMSIQDIETELKPQIEGLF